MNLVISRIIAVAAKNVPTWTTCNPKETWMRDKAIYDRLGGYDAVVVAVDEILPRLMNDSQSGRSWRNRGRDGIAG